MKIAFCSNYFNHHQRFISDEFEKNKNVEKYTFIENTPKREERVKMGWCSREEPDYVVEYNIDESIKMEIIDNVDVLILGGAPEKLIKNRKRNRQLIFRCSERPLKKGLEIHKYIPRFLKWHYKNPKSSFVYMLCASAYTAADYSKFWLFGNKMYKWGYFPETKKYNSIDGLIEKKDKKQILWCGRFLEWKHPRDVLVVAHRLKKQGYDFRLNLVGSGPLKNSLAEFIERNSLKENVFIIENKNPEEVRQLMENAGIYVFSSDYNEGWGAVVNESMNSACAIVASHAAGSVPYLIENNKNGLIYKSGNIDELQKKVEYLLENIDEQRRIGLAAYNTIVMEWNAEVAARRFVNLAEHILAGENHPDLYESGPCSKAEIIKDNWYCRK